MKYQFVLTYHTRNGKPPYQPIELNLKDVIDSDTFPTDEEVNNIKQYLLEYFKRSFPKAKDDMFDFEFHGLLDVEVLNETTDQTKDTVL